MRVRSFIEGLESRRLLAAGFQIQLSFEASVSGAVQSVLQQAANRWQQILIGDVPDVGAGSWGAAVDDIRITARVRSIDGAGNGVAQGRPTHIRSTGKLPIAGEIEIDSSDIAAQTSAGMLSTIVTHELAHALGFGTIWSQFGGITSGLGGGDPLFTGGNALREYRTLSGNGSAAGVPLENSGGAGTRDTHWRESIFKTELLTGFLGSGLNPISRVTIGQFQDLGYQVNYGAADSFSLGTASPPPAGGAGTISGKVFNDSNANGIQDGGETGINARTVYVDANYNNNYDGNEKTATTNGNGDYSLSGLTNGGYSIRTVVPAGSTLTQPQGGLHWVQLNGSASGKNFGTKGGTASPPPAGGAGTISGKVFNDTNSNGIQDGGEPGINARTIYIDANYNNTYDGGEKTATTNGNGDYSLSGLTNTGYSVRTILPSGATLTHPQGGLHWIQLNGSATGKNFGTTGGAASPPTAGGAGTITGRVFNDPNSNGTQDNNESGISSRTVYIDANYNNTYDGNEKTATTDGSGNYALTGLSNTGYSVRTILPSGATLTQPQGGLHWVQLNGSATNKNFGTTGGTASPPTAGGAATLAGKIYYDKNWSGKYESGEQLLASRTVYLDANGNGNLDGGEKTATTDGGGRYTFSNLAAGNYTIRQILPGGWYQTAPNANNAWYITIGGSRSDLDFGAWI